MNCNLKFILFFQLLAILSAFKYTSVYLNRFNNNLQYSSKLFSTINQKTVGNKEVSAVTLKNLILTDYKGEKRRIGDLINKDKSVVVFLRHLGK